MILSNDRFGRTITLIEDSVVSTYTVSNGSQVYFEVSVPYGTDIVKVYSIIESMVSDP